MKCIECKEDMQGYGKEIKSCPYGVDTLLVTKYKCINTKCLQFDNLQKTTESKLK